MESLLFIGLDVDSKAFHGAAYTAKGGYGEEFSTTPTAAALAKRLGQIASPERLRICYEATYLGFSLQRELKALGFHCDVIAPSLVPQMAGKRQKNDRLDSRKLAVMHAKAMLTIVAPPDEQIEADRSLLRSRAFAVRQVTKSKNHVARVAHTFGWDFHAETGKKVLWTKPYRDWLKTKVSRASAVVERTMTLMLGQLDHLERTVREFDEAVAALAKEDRHRKAVTSLTAFRGIDVTTALVIRTELGDITRFDHPKRLVGYVGLGVAEYSSGGNERRFGITKTGNRIVRTALVEACQFAIAPVRVSKDLARRRADATPRDVEIADRAMLRLNKKGFRLLLRGKPRNKIKVALARELLCFVWEALAKAA